ncbi:C-type lectin domain family 17, member A [Collichthys lucidus]|uniref:C-type lectin domain family 17, member A n=1 Tax=Collichthys lucidus TaxID=240159 RepID=A0A4U5V7N7_COLLU|nr:C-type lectin domain family 17, member A [Collichthys lucidus]
MNRKRQEATGEIIEEMDYVNTPVSAVARTAATSDRKSPSFTQSFLPVAVCWAILLVIMSLRIYFTSVMSENNGKLMLHVTGLETQNQKLKEEKNKLTARIQELEKPWNQNIRQAQKSVDLYCPITNGERKCNPCMDQWTAKPPNCYAVNDGVAPNLRTWDSAQERCKEINSNLVVIANDQEKTSVDEAIWPELQDKTFWIGLRAENATWKWLDGSELTNNSWIQQPATVGQCALLHKNNTWTSEDCNKKYQWICHQKALTLT